ncbi:exodeoxyribonuclease VII small subunit [Aneurinibacillus sp. Ricciae_BoGa-3]|uniref:exodeoxyribonuclease VII small subunit n=1 Tax=Aneurinibacillus sp. Ricciae_BoGa-3 TaxID=3022697 RepID=UPI003FA4A4E9
MDNNELHNQNMPFEEAMKKLEEIVSQLEAGEVPLEEAITLFQEGMELSALCNRKLSDVEHRIETLLEKDDDLTAVPFNLEGEDN